MIFLCKNDWASDVSFCFIFLKYHTKYKWFKPDKTFPETRAEHSIYTHFKWLCVYYHTFIKNIKPIHKSKPIFTFCAKRKLGGVGLAIETHAGALIQVHVGIAEETFGHTFHVSRHLIGQLCDGHFQVCADLGAGVNLWDVEAVAFSWTQSTNKPPNTCVNVVKVMGHLSKQTAHLVCLPCCRRRSSRCCWVRVWWRTRSGWSRCRAQRTAPACLWSECEFCCWPGKPWEYPVRWVDGTCAEGESAPKERNTCS